MFDKIELLQMAQAMATRASARQNAVAENIANADTPGYKAKDVVSFAQTYNGADTGGLRATRAGHLDSPARPYTPEMMIRTDPGNQSPNGNTVSLETEMVKAAGVKREHDLALTIFKTTMGIARTSLGRGR